MRTFVINLESSKLRMAEMNQRLTEMNLAYERMPAVNGSQLSTEELHSFYQPALNKKLYRRPLSAGEIGCYMSHRNCWVKIQEQQLDLALILEDDAEMSDQLSALLSNIEKIQQPWDIIKLCDPPKKKAVLNSVQLHIDFKLCLYKKVPSRATGYVVSLSGAKKLLQARETFARPVDDDMQFYWEYSGNIFGVEPSPIWNAQSSLQSDIDNSGSRKSGKTFSSLFKGPFLKLKYELKRIKHNRQRVDLTSYLNNQAEPTASDPESRSQV
jgi:glycosyl transferase family 25